MATDKAKHLVHEHEVLVLVVEASREHLSSEASVSSCASALAGRKTTGEARSDMRSTHQAIDKSRAMLEIQRGKHMQAMAWSTGLVHHPAN